MYLTVIAAALADSSVRTLSQQEELPLLRDHLLRLDRNSRRDRFHGFMDDSFIERYAEKCANDGTTIINLPEDAKGTTTLESKTNFIGGAKEGMIVIATATPVHRGRRTQVWQTRLETEEGRLIALVTQTQMVLG